MYNSNSGMAWGSSALANMDPNALNFGEGSPSGLSFNQGSVALPLVDTNQLVQTPKVQLGRNPTDLTGMDKANIALGGLQTLGSLYMAFQANKLAKKQFAFQKDYANQNLANSIKNYNTTLEDRIRSRAVTEGRPDGYADGYLAQHQMTNQMAKKKG